MDEIRLGKIKSVTFGLGGYQGLEFGLWLDLGSSTDNWGVMTSVSAGWSYQMDRSDYTKWSEEDRDNSHIDMNKRLVKVLEDAKIDTVDKLLGKPVEVIFENNKLKDWRILIEVI